ncbi:MAG: hypothetical protein Q8910_04245 [Bacteroidota bacterium]|nr:hypothetical protein [Bacteroidota bacterium]
MKFIDQIDEILSTELTQADYFKIRVGVVNKELHNRIVCTLQKNMDELDLKSIIEMPELHGTILVNCAIDALKYKMSNN